jgi:hypothetical protein
MADWHAALAIVAVGAVECCIDAGGDFDVGSFFRFLPPVTPKARRVNMPTTLATIRDRASAPPRPFPRPKQAPARPRSGSTSGACAACTLGAVATTRLNASRYSAGSGPDIQARVRRMMPGSGCRPGLWGTAAKRDLLALFFTDNDPGYPEPVDQGAVASREKG